ncbi:MAG: histidine phosphatase family protein [Acidobacteriota bacterium]
MKKLLLLRHAKSSWADAHMTDFDRPLNERGLAAAPFMGGIISRERLIPDFILSSPAERARNTAELVRLGGGLEIEIRYDERIYEASPQKLQQILAEIDPKYISVMMVGHNPGIEGLARVLTGVNAEMPTAALAEIDLNIEDWKDIGPGVGDHIRVIRPKGRLKVDRDLTSS